MPEMKDSGIEWASEIPKNWDMRRLQFCLEEVKVKNNPIQTTQVLSLMKDVGVLPYEEKGDIGNRSKEDVSEYHLAYPNTIVLNCMNILIGSVGISNYFGCVSPVYYVFKETQDSDLRFINYIFNTREFQKELRKYANGILEIRLRVSANDIFKRKVPLPSKKTQIRIADFLDSKCAEIDALSADIQSEIDTLEAYKRSVIIEAVTKGLDKNVPMKDSGMPWVGAVPQHWLVEKVKYHLTRYEPKNPGNQQVLSVYREYGVIPKDSRDDNHNVTSENTSKYKYVKHGNLVINKMKAWQGSMGVSDYEGIVSPAYFIYHFIDEMLIPKYLHYLFRSCYKDEFRRISGGIREGQWDLSPEAFANTLILLPPVDEQLAIVEAVDEKTTEIESIIAQKQEQLAVLADYKKSVIYEYVTGKKEVPNE